MYLTDFKTFKQYTVLKLYSILYTSCTTASASIGPKAFGHFHIKKTANFGRFIYSTFQLVTTVYHCSELNPLLLHLK